jgi:hypothetical protein
MMNGRFQDNEQLQDVMNLKIHESLYERMTATNAHPSLKG